MILELSNTINKSKTVLALYKLENAFSISSGVEENKFQLTLLEEADVLDHETHDAKFVPQLKRFLEENRRKIYDLWKNSRGNPHYKLQVEATEPVEGICSFSLT